MNNTKIITLLFVSLVFLGCTKSTFTGSVEIDAPVSIVFGLLTDYENYDVLIPDLHDSIEIVSEQKTGLGVAWANVGTFKGYTVESTWTVTEFEENKLVKLEDLESNYATAILSTKVIDINRTLYNKEINSIMYKPYEKDIFEIYNKEMRIIKEESERLYAIELASNK